MTQDRQELENTNINDDIEFNELDKSMVDLTQVLFI